MITIDAAINYMRIMCSVANFDEEFFLFKVEEKFDKVDIEAVITAILEIERLMTSIPVVKDREFFVIDGEAEDGFYWPLRGFCHHFEKSARFYGALFKWENNIVEDTEDDLPF